MHVMDSMDYKANCYKYNQLIKIHIPTLLGDLICVNAIAV